MVRITHQHYELTIYLKEQHDMAKITNLDELKRLHDWSRVAKIGSKAWIDFANTMIDSFPALYETAKNMNARMEEMQKAAETAGAEIKRLRSIVHANHKWHEDYDDYGGYPDSDLCQLNESGLAPDDYAD